MRPNADFLSIRPLRTHLNEIIVKYKKNSFQDNTLDSLICKMSDILSMPQYVVLFTSRIDFKPCWYSEHYTIHKMRICLKFYKNCPLVYQGDYLARCLQYSGAISTYWGKREMANNLQTIFQMHFWEGVVLIEMSLNVVSYGQFTTVQH